MKKQEIFDKVYRHLLVQGVRAEDDNGCRYRIGKLMCAIGCLIPDELYDEKIEEAAADRFVADNDLGSSVSNSAAEKYRLCRKIGKKIGLYPSQRSLLVALQTVHDEHEPSGWEVALRHVANNHGLRVSI